ncbi:MAG: cyclodeaminase/cyclohydrolase family protein [Candidatus Limnocylindria bacterium]
MDDDASFARARLGDFTEALAGADPVPGGGSAAAVAGAVAAALVQMVARLTIGREKYAAFERTALDIDAAAARARMQLLELADLDAAAYRAFVAARRKPRSTDAEREARRVATERTAQDAVRVPLRVTRAAAEVTSLAARLAASSNPNASSDVGAAAHLAAAAARAAALNVRINLPSLGDADPLRETATAELDGLLSAVQREERAALEQVEMALA